jgi:hypothetical protein
MSTETNIQRDRWSFLAPSLRPREENQGSQGPSNLRLIETTLLVLAGLLLAIAAINDVARQVHVNQRLIADLHTWRTVTGHDYHNLTVEQDQTAHSTREVVCGNTIPGPPGKRPQLCLVMTGPTAHNLRAARGGYYLPPEAIDLRRYRYGCFGSTAHAKLCALSKPPSSTASRPQAKGS